MGLSVESEGNQSAYWPPGEEERYRERLQLEHQLQKIKDEVRALMIQIERLQSELQDVPRPPGEEERYRERLQLEHQLQSIKDKLRALMVQMERLQSELREVPWPRPVRPNGGAVYR